MTERCCALGNALINANYVLVLGHAHVKNTNKIMPSRGARGDEVVNHNLRNIPGPGDEDPVAKGFFVCSYHSR